MSIDIAFIVIFIVIGLIIGYVAYSGITSKGGGIHKIVNSVVKNKKSKKSKKSKKCKE
jgi:hypothetical protein